jgi:hypothetical protein
MNMRRITIIGLLLAIGCAPACMPFFCVACDNSVTVKGDVYEWLDPPVGASSVIHLDSIPAEDLRVAPISGVEITLERWPKDTAQHDARIRKSDQDGRFAVGLVVGPGGVAAVVSASAAGFRSVERPFRHEGKPHTARVLLVREK